jgi:hypothetical protein
VALKKGMEIALQVVIDFLKDMTMTVSSEDEIFNVDEIIASLEKEA